MRQPRRPWSHRTEPKPPLHRPLPYRLVEHVLAYRVEPACERGRGNRSPIDVYVIAPLNAVRTSHTSHASRLDATFPPPTVHVVIMQSYVPKGLPPFRVILHDDIMTRGIPICHRGWGQRLHHIGTRAGAVVPDSGHAACATESRTFADMAGAMRNAV